MEVHCTSLLEAVQVYGVASVGMVIADHTHPRLGDIQQAGTGSDIK